MTLQRSRMRRSVCHLSYRFVFLLPLYLSNGLITCVCRLTRRPNGVRRNNSSERFTESGFSPHVAIYSISSSLVRVRLHVTLLITISCLVWNCSCHARAFCANSYRALRTSSMWHLYRYMYSFSRTYFIFSYYVDRRVSVVTPVCEYCTYSASTNMYLNLIIVLLCNFAFAVDCPFFCPTKFILSR